MADAREIANAVAGFFGGSSEPQAEPTAEPTGCPHCGKAPSAPPAEGAPSKMDIFKQKSRNSFGNQ